MSLKVAKWIFWLGTLSSLGLFLALTYDTTVQFDALTHADKLDERAVAGKKVFEKYLCNDCHTILGFGAYYAPDLTRAYSRLGADGIARRVAQPEVAFKDSFRHMPQQHLAKQEIDDVVTYFKWVDAIENHDWPPQDSPHRWKHSTERLMADVTLSPAAAIIKQEDCLSCHSIGGKGGDQGPRLEYVGSNHDAQWIADYLAKPEAMAPGAAMPAFDKLSPGQRRMVADFLVAVGREPAR